VAIVKMNEEIVKTLGYKDSDGFNVKGRLSISDLYPKSKSRCGIYLLKFSNDTFYIGQAVDAVKRFSQHRKNYDDIIHYWFQPIDKKRLDEVEQNFIKQAENSGLLLTNKTFVTNVIGETDLDLIVSPEEQKNWLEGQIELPDGNFDLYSTIGEKFKIKYRYNFLKLKQSEHYEKLKILLGLYVRNCIPAFKKTELSFWSLTALPSTNKSTWPRYFCLNINGMEVFVAGVKKDSNKPFAFIIVSGYFLEEKENIKILKSKYSSIEIEESNYRAAGQDQYLIHLKNYEEVQRILSLESSIVQSAKELNLRLMRKGGTIYSPYHCFDLAKDILE
jgi:hypothetical protein